MDLFLPITINVTNGFDLAKVCANMFYQRIDLVPVKANLIMIS